MIQATDLRIGNTVYDWAKRIAVVESIHKDGSIRLSSEGNYKYESFKSEHLSPIPLTEEILLKCGFEKKDIVKWHGNGYDYQPEGVFTEQQDYVLNVGEDNDIIVRFEKWSLDNDTKMQIHNCNWYVRCYGLINCEIKHLHQLQNLYWCLCAKELEVNL